MKVLIADDHPLFRDAMRHVMASAVEDVTCIEVKDFNEAREFLQNDDTFDLLLLDLNMPGMNGFTGMLELRETIPEIPMVIVSASEEPDIIQRAMTCGAMGYITKSALKDEMVAAIHKVLAGGIVRPNDAAKPKRPSTRDTELMECLGSLTKRQGAVLSLLAKGKSNKQIAFELDVTNTTVKAHITAILRKLKVTSRTQAVIVARQLDGLKRG